MARIPYLIDAPAVLGSAGSPLPRLPRQLRVQVKEWIAGAKGSSDRIAPEYLLRAYLLVGESPVPELLEPETITVALPDRDIMRHARKLCNVQKVIDALPLIGALESRLSLAEGKKSLSTYLKEIPRLLERVRLNESMQVRLTEQSEHGVLRLMTSLTIKTRSAWRKGRNKDRQRLEKLIGPMVTSTLRLAYESASPLTWLSLRELLRTISEGIGSLPLEEILSHQGNSEILHKMVTQINNRVVSLAEKGQSEGLEVMREAVQALQGGDAEFQAALRKLSEAGAGRLPQNVQEVIVNCLGLELAPTAPKEISLLGREVPLRVTQLASSLLYAWGARTEGPRSMESFRVLEDVVKKFFSLRLGGEIGSVIGFDDTCHSSTDKARTGEQVRILRPWVEWNDGEMWRIVIRAVVEPTKSSLK